MSTEDGWTKSERMQVWILRFLDEEGEYPGWRMWVNIAEERSLDVNRWEFYRRQIGALDRIACIAKTGEFDNSEKKGKHWGTAYWRLTAEGKAELDRLEAKYMVWARSDEGDEPDVIEKWIGQTITGENMVPKDEWGEVFDALRANRIGFRVFRVGDNDLEAEDLL